MRRRTAVALALAAAAVSTVVAPIDPAGADAPAGFSATLGLAPSIASPLASTPIGPDPFAAVARDALDQWFIFATTGLGQHLRRFLDLRDALALEAGRRLEIDGRRIREAWARADQRHQLVLLAAMTQLGTPYRKHRSDPGSGFDCSGLTTFAWAATDVALPRQSLRQIRLVAPVAHESAQAGDLVWYPGHVSLYLGVDFAIIHASDYDKPAGFGFIRTDRRRTAKFGAPLGAPLS